MEVLIIVQLLVLTNFLNLGQLGTLNINWATYLCSAQNSSLNDPLSFSRPDKSWDCLTWPQWIEGCIRSRIHLESWLLVSDTPYNQTFIVYSLCVNPNNTKHLKDYLFSNNYFYNFLNSPSMWTNAAKHRNKNKKFVQLFFLQALRQWTLLVITQNNY